MNIFTSRSFYFSLLFIVIFFGSCKKNSSSVDEAALKPSAWEQDMLFPTNDYYVAGVKNGSIKLIGALGKVATCTWDTLNINKEQAFAARKIDNVTLPSDWFTSFFVNDEFAISERFAVYHRPIGIQSNYSLKIRALDNNSHNNIVEIMGKSIDPNFKQFITRGYGAIGLIRIIGDYIFVPYEKVDNQGPSFAIVKLKAREAGLPATANDVILVEKITLVNQNTSSPNAFLCDVAAVKNKFLFSFYGAKIFKTSVVNLNGEIEATSEYNATRFIALPNGVILGLKNIDQGLGPGLITSDNLGKNWHNYVLETPLAIFGLKFSVVNNNLIGADLRQLFLTNTTGGNGSTQVQLNFKELDNTGLPDRCNIRYLFAYGPEKVGLITDKGVYVKKIKDLFNEK